MAIRLTNSTRQPFWGDLHNHNEVGYGKGSLGRSYAIAKGIGLDVYAFTPHAFWPDPPMSDAKVATQHLEAFDAVQRQWNTVKATANAANVDGRFVAFVAWEWHSSQWGDFHVLLSGSDGEIFRAGSLAELQEYARRAGALLIPHHLAYREGWRGTKWSEHQPDVSPLADVFSEHACGMEPETHWPMLAHSMGGSERSQTVSEQLKRGRRVGLVGSTDNHWGHPGSYAEGLAGIWAETLTRSSVIEALRRRHTYAVTGDRIGLEFFAGNGMMGDALPAGDGRSFRGKASALGEVDYIEIQKNGARAAWWPGSMPGGESEEFNVRIEFGWDGLQSRDVTDWRIKLSVADGEFAEIYPCFCGGEGSVEKINRVVSFESGALEVEVFTSRSNSRPTSAFVVRLHGTEKTRLRLDAAAMWRGKPCGCVLGDSIGALREQSLWGSIDEVFSAPKISMGHALSREETEISFAWTDPSEAAEGDYYLAKVQQRNGHVAWSSPIWFGERNL